jgi:hypothetical protein
MSDDCFLSGLVVAITIIIAVGQIGKAPADRHDELLRSRAAAHRQEPTIDLCSPSGGGFVFLKTPKLRARSC